MLPILRSIISQERNSLKHLQFPHSWRDIEYADPQFVAFLNEYNQVMGDRDTTFCKKCNKIIPMVFVWKLVGRKIGLQFKRIPAASVQTISVTTAKLTIIISKVFVCVSPVSVVTVLSVRRW